MSTQRQDIPYPTTTHFIGRNGYFKSSGLEIYHTGTSHIVILQPTTTRDTTGRCSIEIPSDPVTLRQVAAALLDIADRCTPQPRCSHD